MAKKKTTGKGKVSSKKGSGKAEASFSKPKKLETDGFFEVSIEDIPSGEVLPFPIYLHFKLNTRLVQIRKANRVMEPNVLHRYREHKLDQFWVPNHFRPAFEDWLSKRKLQRMPNMEPMPVEPEVPQEFPRAPSAAMAAIEILTDPRIHKSKKAEMMSKMSEELMSRLRLMGKKTPKETRRAMAEMFLFSQSLIDAILAHIPQSEDYQTVLKTFDELKDNHSLAVSTFSMLFALGIGMTDHQELADLSLGSLIHDVGTTQIHADLLEIPIEKMNADQKTSYEAHVTIGLSLLYGHGIKVPKRIESILAQHHERFDGKGYPEKLKGGEISPLVTVVAMADFFHERMSGVWDGKEHSMEDCCNALAAIHANPKKYGEPFDPAILGHIVNYLKNTDIESEVLKDKSV